MLPPRCTQFDPSKHHVHQTELSGSLQRRLNLPNLFTYRHALSKNWVVAYWVNKDRGWMMELTLMGNLGDFGPDNQRTLERWAAGKMPTAETLIREDMRNLRAAELAEVEEAAEGMEHKQALRKMCPATMQDHPFWGVPGLSAGV